MGVRLKPPIQAYIQVILVHPKQSSWHSNFIHYVVLNVYILEGKHNYIPTKDQSAQIKKTYYCRDRTVTILYRDN